MELLRIHKNRSLDNRKCQQFKAPWLTNNFSKPTTADWMSGVKTTVDSTPSAPEGNSGQKPEATSDGATSATGTNSETSQTKNTAQSGILGDLYNYNQAREKEQTDRNNISDKDYFGQAITKRSFDTNGNGHIGKHEFRDWLNNNGFGNMSKAVQKMFRGYMNGKNSITPEMAEYMNNSQNLNPVSKAAQQKLDEQKASEAKLNNSDFQTYARQQFVNDQKNAAANKFKDMDYSGLLKYAQDMYKANNSTWDAAKFGDFTKFGGARGKVTDAGMDNLINSGDWKNPYEREAFKNAWVKLRNTDAAHKVSGATDTNYDALGNDAYATYDQEQWDANKNSYVNMDKYNAMLQSQKDAAQAEANKNTWSTVKHKQGGSLKMKVNYFQPGGVVAAQTASAKPDVSSQLAKLILTATQDEKALTQVVQLLQSGEPQVQEAIKTMTAKAQQGDEEAAQATQVLQAIMKKMQGQAQSAKRGAKLSYLHSLKTGCPDGYEVSYNKKGGHLCKECLKKQANGGELSEEDKKMGRGTPEQVKAVAAQLKKKYPQYTKEQLAGSAPIIKNGQKYFMNGDGELIAASKLTPKDACGSKLKKKLISGKKLAEGNKITPTKQASKNFFGGKLYLNY